MVYHPPHPHPTVLFFSLLFYFYTAVLSFGAYIYAALVQFFNMNFCFNKIKNLLLYVSEL